jgi:hypothetical protein
VSRIREAWSRALWAPTDAGPIGLLRIAVGFIVTVMLLERIPHARAAYSDAGWIPNEAAVQLMDPWHWSIFHVIDAPWQVIACLIVGAVAAAAFTIGRFTRVAGLVAFVVLSSVHVRNPAVLYGADSVARIFLFYLLLVPCGAAYSWDATRERSARAHAALAEGVDPRTRRRRVAEIPVWPVRLFQIQVMIIYLTTGISKSYGVDYEEGLALWYALVNPVHSRFYPAAVPLYEAVFPVLKIATVITLWWELAFAFMVPFRRLRTVALLTGLVVHGGIYFLLEIEWWGPLMMMSYLAFVSGRSLHRLGLRAIRDLRSTRWKNRLRLLYDPADARALELATRIATFDPMRMVALEAAPGIDGGTELSRREDGSAVAPEGMRQALRAAVPITGGFVGRRTH